MKHNTLAYVMGYTVCSPALRLVIGLNDRTEILGVIAIHRMSHSLVSNESRLLHHQAASPPDDGSVNWL